MKFWLFLVENYKYVVELKFRNSKFFLYHSLILAKTIFNLLANSIGLGFVIMRLVSSAYNVNLTFSVVIVGKSLCIIKKIKGWELNVVVMHA